MTVEQLISRLQFVSPYAKVEFQVPRLKPGDRETLDGARFMVTGIQETFYNDPSNKYVVLI